LWVQKIRPGRLTWPFARGTMKMLRVLPRASNLHGRDRWNATLDIRVLCDTRAA
jgi:hypothetical protein